MKPLREFSEPQPDQTAPASNTPSVGLSFNLLVQAWNRLRKDRIDDLRRLAPNMSSLDKVFLRKIAEDDSTITVEFTGLDTAALDQTRAAEVRRMIEIWLQRISSSVQKVRNTNTVLTLKLSKSLKVGHIDATPSNEKMNTGIQKESKYEHKNPGDLTRIIIERGN